jgi:hypothetical protein
MAAMRMRVALAVMARMRVRIALALAFAAILIGFLIDMSGSAPRLAGDDHVAWPPVILADTVTGGGVVCLTGVVVPDDAARMVMTIGNILAAPFPLPRIAVDFRAASGRELAGGVLAAGAAPGENVSIPLRYPHGPSAAGTLCLHVGGHRALHFGAEAVPVASESGTTVDGVAQPSRPAILYYRPGRDSWWALLGTLDFRLGLGKSAIFGDWTLPVLVLAALALWVGVVRLVVRELR